MARRGGATAGRALALVGLKLLLFCCLKPPAHASSDESIHSSNRISIPHLDVAQAGSSWWQQDPTGASPASPRHTQHQIQHLAGQPCDQPLSVFSSSRTQQQQQQQQHSFVLRVAGCSFQTQLAVRGVDTTPRAGSSIGSASSSMHSRPQAAGGLRWQASQQQHHHRHQQQRPTVSSAAARRLLWGRRLLQLDLKLLQGASREQEVQKDILRLQQIQKGDANLRLAYVQYALYYLLTCGGFNGGQDVAAAAAAYRTVPDSNPQYAAAGVVELRLQLLEEILPRATSAGRRNVEECDWYYNTLAPDVSPAFTLQGLSPNPSTAPVTPNGTAESPSPSPSVPPASSPSPEQPAASSPSPSPGAAESSSPSPAAPSPQPTSPAPNSPSPSGSGGGGGQGQEAGAAPGFFWNGSKWVPVSSGLPPPGGVVMGVLSGGMPAGGSSGEVVGR